LLNSKGTPFFLTEHKYSMTSINISVYSSPTGDCVNGFNITPGQRFRFAIDPLLNSRGKRSSARSSSVGYTVPPEFNSRGKNSTPEDRSSGGKEVYELRELWVADDIDDNLIIKYVNVETQKEYNINTLRNDTKIILVDTPEH